MEKIGVLLLTLLVLIAVSTSAYAAPYYDCYDTYAELTQKTRRWNSQFPNLVEIIDAGDSWEKQQNQADRDLWVVRITNENAAGEKPAVFYVGEHHARELASSQILIDFIENELLAKYGSDPTITNLLDTREFHILPMANPDGHVKAENGANWRKNTNDSASSCQGGTLPNSYGVDMNRNYGKGFGGSGSSGNACSATYRGNHAFSEPETAAIRNYINNMSTPPQVLITYHSFSNLILYPWAHTAAPAPHQQQLDRLANLLADLTITNSSPSRYAPGSTGGSLYLASGATDDWFYDQYRLPAFTFELGDTFVPTCSRYQTIYEKNVKPMVFAAQIASDPWNPPSATPTVPPPTSTLTPSGTPTLSVTSAPTPTSSATPSITPSPRNTDINEDGRVDQQDLQILLDNWNLPAPFLYPKADINGDGVINAIDAGSIFTAW